MLISLVSVRHGPGVSTAALALGWTWARTAVVAECDPAGGEALLALDGAGEYGRGGLHEMLISARLMPLEHAMWAQVVGLPDGTGRHFLLPGPRSHRESATVDWDRVARLFAGYDTVDVLADCGGVTAAGFARPVLMAADLVVVLVRNDARSVRSTFWSVDRLREEIGAAGRGESGMVGVAVSQDGGLVEQWPVREIDAQLRPAGLPVIGELPWDPAAAAVLAHGRPTGRRFSTSPLMRAATRLGREIGQLAFARSEQLRGSGVRRQVPAEQGIRPSAARGPVRAQRLVSSTQRPVPKPSSPAPRIEGEAVDVG